MLKRLLVLCLFTLYLNSICIYAYDNMLETSDTEYANSNIVKENIHLTVLNEENINSPIRCFDVSDNGMIALGLEDDSINVYDKNGKYLYGFSFDVYGTYYIRWNGENLIIYLARENLAVEISNGSSGDIRSIKEIIDEWSYASPTFKYMFNANKKFNGDEYQISKNMGPFNLISGSYSKLEIIKDDGTRDTIFDVSKMYTIRLALEFTFIVVLLIIIFSVLIKTIKQYNPKVEE